MRLFAYGLLVWLSLLVQVTWTEPLGVRTARLDMPLVLAVWFGLTADRRTAGFCGWGLGLATDVLSAGPVGLHALLYLLLSLTIAAQRKVLPGERSPLVQAVLASTAVLLVHAAVPVAAARLTGGAGGVALSRAFADAVLAAVVAPALFALLNRLPTGWTRRPEHR